MMLRTSWSGSRRWRRFTAATADVCARRRSRARARGRWHIPATLVAALHCAGCSPDRPPPPTLFFAGLPVSGTWDTALGARFDKCIDMDAVNIRCRRHDVRLFGVGPYEAAVDLRGRNGKYGFTQLTLWSDTDNDAIYDAIVALARRGWRYCYTGTEQWGDQAIFSRRGERVRVFIDISYWGKRRLRVIPLANTPPPISACVADRRFWRFGMDVERAIRSGEDRPPRS